MGHRDGGDDWGGYPGGAEMTREEFLAELRIEDDAMAGAANDEDRDISQWCREEAARVKGGG